MSIIATSIETSLQKLGKSQAWLAQASDLTPAAISQYLSRDRQPTVDAMLKLCVALGTTPNDLLGFHAPSKSVQARKIKDLEMRMKQILWLAGRESE
jgi:transcriptional regulator with XRE-family HTH domain